MSDEILPPVPAFVPKPVPAPQPAQEAPSKASSGVSQPTEAEKLLGYARPLRDAVRHKGCGTVTVIGPEEAVDLAKRPGSASPLRCATCARPFPADHFVWHEAPAEVVGT